MGIMWLLLQSSSDTIISMILPDLVSIFTVEVSATSKALEQIKDSVASKYIILQTLMCIQALQYMKLVHPLIRMVIRKSLFKLYQ